MKQVPLGVACEDFPGPTVSSPDEVIRDAHALGEGESPGPARRPRCSYMSEKKNRRPFRKIKFFSPNGRW